LLTAEINALKFRYRINIGITQPKAEVIKTFAIECIRLIETSAKSKLRLSDACYLAVSALIRLYELENDMTYLFQAAYLLEALSLKTLTLVKSCSYILRLNSGCTHLP
jgi:hypothetical protein